MKSFIVLTAVVALSIFSAGCSKNDPSGKTYRGRLEITGACMNYTIAVLAGDIDTSAIVVNWTDPATNKSYTNVFRLGSVCDFPATIKQGDEFDFIIDPSPEKSCVLCLAYYPTPSKSLSIKVTGK